MTPYVLCYGHASMYGLQHVQLGAFTYTRILAKCLVCHLTYQIIFKKKFSMKMWLAEK